MKTFVLPFLVAILWFHQPLARAASPAPAVFHVTESASSGDIVGLQGGNFGAAPQVWLDQIASSSDTPNPEVQVSRILRATNEFIAFRVPDNFGSGLYAVFVKNPATGLQSKPVWINQPDVWQTLDLAGRATDPGRQFRLYGRNLTVPNADPRVRFVSVQTGVSLPAVTTPGPDQFIVNVTAPTTLVPGNSYDLYVSNGTGGSLGEVKTIRLSVQATGEDYFGLNVPWAGEFDFFDNIYDITTDSRLSVKATGDGVANDARALQEAIDKAHADGGGVVYLPTGRYNMAATKLTMRSHVVLQGAGMDQSVIFDNSAGGAGSGPMFNPEAGNWYEVSPRIGVADLTMSCGPKGFHGTWKVGGSGPMFLVRSKFENAVKEVVVYGANRMLIQDCIIIHTARNGKNVLDLPSREEVLIRNCYIQWADGRIFLDNARRFQLENNQWMRSVDTDGTALGYGGTSLGHSSEVAIIGNTFGKVGDGKIPYNNDGETILNENVSRIAVGQATGATDTTLQDTSRNWKANVLKSNFFNGRTEANYIVIIKGPGMGQRRQVVSNTSNTITVSPAWDVLPTSASSYTVVDFDEHFLIKDNVMQDVPRGIWLYGCNLDEVAIVNNQLINADKIWLRGDQRTNESRFNVQRNVLIEGNLLQNTRNWYGAQIAVDLRHITSTTLMGNAFYNVVVRDNRIETLKPNFTTVGDGAVGEGFFNIVSPTGNVDNNTAAALGVIFQDNTGVNTDWAFNLNTGSYQTIIWNNAAQNARGLLRDDSLSQKGGKHGSVGTVVGSSP